MSIPRLLVLITLGSLVLPLARAAEEWTQVDAPHFTILTTAAPKVARQWAVELEKFRRTLQLVVAVPEERVRPATIVLFKTERAMRPFKPLENGRPKDVGGFFVPVADSHAFALALDEPTKTVRRILFHEAVHWHSAAGEFPLPTWLEEGVAEVYSTFETRDDGTVSFGRALQEHVQLIGGREIDLPKLMRLSRDALKYNDGGQARPFYAASWGIAHYLLFGQDTPGRDSIARYLAAARMQDATAAFRAAFGVNEEEFSRRLAAYMKRGSYTVYNYRVDLGTFEQQLRVGPAAPGEVDRALGVLLLGSRGAATPEVWSRLQRAAELNPASARAWQALGEAALVAKDHAAAARHFQRAVEAGSDSYYVHYGLGTCRMQDQDQLAGLVSPAEAGRAAENFRRAIALNPRFVPAYEGLGGLIMVLDRYDPEDRARLEHAHRLAPESPMVRVGLALCDLRAGRSEEGRAALRALVDSPFPPREQLFAREVLVEEDWRDFTQRIERLFEQRKFGEALALIEEAKTQYPPRYRRTLEQNRRLAAASVKLARAVDLLNAREHAAAREVLAEVLQSDADSRAHAEARRLLTLIPAS
jgi:tetratricopeptide (TPR) repeat protein